MAEAVAGHPAAVAVGGALYTVGRLLDVEPGQGALHRAEGLVHIQAGPVVVASAGLAPRAARVPLAGRGPVRLVVHAEGWRGGCVQGTAGLLGREALGSVAQGPQFVRHRELRLVHPLRVVELAFDSVGALFPCKREEAVRG